MAINANHPFEDLDGIKCAVVEKNCTPVRVEFLKPILEFNGYTVVVAKSPPPKVPTAKPLAEGETAPPPPPPAPETFTLGVTDVRFSMVNSIFGRLLKTPDGHVITLAYWQQKENISQDDVPYFEKKKA